MGLIEDMKKSIESVAGEICDKYCKYPEQYAPEEWDELAFSDESPCITCPISRLW